MKYRNGRKLSFYLSSFLIALLTFFSVSVEALATHKFELDLSKCTTDGYNLSDEGDLYDMYQSCLSDYKSGSSYLYSDGDSIEPGTYVLAIPKYIYGGTTEVLGYNTRLVLDENLWLLISDSEGDYLFVPDVSKADGTFPSKGGRNPSCTWKPGALRYNGTSNSIFLFRGNDSEFNKLMFDKDYVLGYALFQLKPSAASSGGKTTDFTFQSYSFSDKDGYSLSSDKVDAKGLNVIISGGLLSKDTTLNTLGVTGSNGKTYSLSPTFVPGAETPKDFATTVPYDVTSVDISATVHDENAKGIVISKVVAARDVSSSNALSVGSNQFSVVVTSEEGTVGTYTVDVKRLNNVATLDGITFTNGVAISGFSSGTKSYTINNVPYSVHDTVVTPVLTDSNGQIKSGDGTWTLSNHGANTNTRKIVAQAENCKAEYASVPGNEGKCVEEEYIINLNRVNPSNNGFLSSLKVDNVSVPGFQPSKLEYTLDAVRYDKSSVNVTASVADTGKANIKSGTGVNNLTLGNNTINVVVTAENGVDTTYKIHIRRMNNDKALNSLVVSSTPAGTLFPTSFSSSTLDYIYTYDPTVTSVSITATVHDLAGATVLLTDTTGGGTSGPSATVTESYGTNVRKVSAFVLAEDGSSQTYTITLNRTQSTNNDLSSLTVTNGSTSYALSPDFSASRKSYTVEVPSNVSSVDINAVAVDSLNATVTGHGTKSLGFGDNDFEINVKAESGANATYFVKVVRKKSNDAGLATLTVDGTLVPGFSTNTTEYTLPKVLFSKSSVIIDGTFNDSYASFVSGNGTVNLRTGNNALEVVTKAQDGTTKTYTINIERSKNKDATVKSVKVHGIDATLSGDGKYTVTLPNNYSTVAPSDVVIGISEDATLTRPTNTINLLTTAVNRYTFTVTAEDTSIVLPYEIEITREKSTDVAMGKVTLTLNDGTTRECTMGANSCKIEVPVNTTGFDLSAEINSVASISPVNGTHHDMGASESTKAITLTVTAEDGTTTKQYTVNVERQKSNDNDLKDLSINGTTVTGFSPETTLYENITFPASTTSINVGAVVNDTGKAAILTDLSQPFELDFGENTISVVVRAEDTKQKTYTLKVIREKGHDATLSDLSINGTTVTDFAATTLEYTLPSVDYNTIALNVAATPTDSLANATGTGSNIALTTGDNEIIITVTAHDGYTTKDYKVKVNRAKNSDTGIKGITVAGVAATHEGGTNYSVTVPNNVTIADNTNVVVTVNDPRLSTDPLATYAVASTNLSTKVTNNVAIIVTSENSTSETYTVAVTREKSNVATLDSLTVTGGSFSPSFKSGTLEYTVTVPVTTTGFEIDAVKTDPESTIISGVGHVDMGPTESSMKKIVTVTSEDGYVTKEYILNIERTKSSVNTLGSLTVSNGDTNYPLNETFAPETTGYTVNVPGSVDNVDIAAVLTDTRAQIVSGLGNHSLNVGNNNIVIRVRSESGSPLDYTVNVIRARKTDADLTDLKIDGITVPNFDPDIINYTIATPYPNEKTSVSISYTKSDTDATVTGDTIVKNLATGNNDIVLTVTAQDPSVSKTYTVHVTREKSGNNKLSLLRVGSYELTPAFDAETLNYTITVPEDKSEIRPNDIQALPQDSTATVSLTSGTLPLVTVGNGENVYVITVTAENGLPEQYSIKVIRPKSTDGTLKDVTLNGATLGSPFNPLTTEYTINVPYGATSFDITGIPNVSTTQVAGNGTYNVGEQTSVMLTTLPEAGAATSKTYTFNIVEAKSNDATLSNLYVSGYPFKDTNGANVTFESAITTYNIGNIPYGVTELLVNATPTNPASTIKYFVGSNEQSSNRVVIPQLVGPNTITVKSLAPDGITPKDYIISYNLVYSDNAYLSTLRPSVGSLAFNKTNFVYELNVGNEVDSIDFDITTEDPNARISVNGSTYATPKRVTVSDLDVGNTTLSILVTAQDGNATNPYSVVIKKAAPVASSDATLSSLEVVDYPFATDFSADTEDYTIGSIPYGVEQLTINATPNIGASRISYSVNGVGQTSNVVNIPKTNGTGEILVHVVAQDGHTTKDYRIAYSKTAKDIAFLSNLTVSEGTLTFAKETLDYTVTLPDGVDSVSLTATKEDSDATMKVNSAIVASPHTYTVTPIGDGDNKVIIEVTAEDGHTALTYTVNFKKNSSGPTIPDKITSVEYGHNIDDDYIRTVMIDTTAGKLKADELDNDVEYLHIYESDGTTEVADTDNLATGMVIKLIINDEVKDQKVIAVVGDTNGDGKITMVDGNVIIGHFLKLTPIDGAYLVAADTNYDDKITMVDGNVIIGHFLKLTPITRPSTSGS